MIISLGILLNSILLISSRIYSGNEGNYLQYPEPAEGWDKDNCQSKSLQSPIEIPSMKDENVIKDDGSAANIIDMIYPEISGVNVSYDGGHKWTTQKLLNSDKRIIKLNLNKTSYIYELKSFHFHLYSEHRLESKQYPMEMHLVHENQDTSNKLNQYLVLGILFDYADDKENKFLKDIHLSTGEEITGASLSDLIKKNDTFYYYKGSLTTEPCDETVNWIVFKDIKAMSYQQYEDFKKWVEGSNPKYYGAGYGNARGPKPLNKRSIFLENEKGLESSKDNFLVITIVSLWIYLMLILY